MANTIEFVYPTLTKAVSVTGEECSLNCPHCNSHYLKQMTPIEKLEPGIEKSYLISGGCNPNGAVPLAMNLSLLHNLKNLGYRINAHTGLIGKEDIEKIASLIDVASFDMIGSDETIREVYNLDKTVWDFIECYKNLRKKVKVVPYITVGLHSGEIKGEYIALRALQSLKPETVVFNVFTPLKGTKFQHAMSTEVEDIKKLFRRARVMLPKATLCLGCIKPNGKYAEAVETAAIDLGFNKLVNPTPEAKNYAVEKGFLIKESRECCTLG